MKPEIYEKIVRFKRSFAETAWKVYRSDLMPPEVLAEMDVYEVPARAEIDGTMDQLRSLSKKLDKIEGRLGVIEARMSAEAIINTRQQWQIKSMIEQVGEALFEQKANKMPKTQCHAMVHEVVQTLKRNLKVDWTEPSREEIRAGVRSAVKTVLRKKKVFGKRTWSRSLVQSWFKHRHFTLSGRLGRSRIISLIRQPRTLPPFFVRYRWSGDFFIEGIIWP